MRIPLSLQLHRADGLLDCAACGRLLQLCSDRRLLRQGRQIHAVLVLNSVCPDNFLASKLISFYARANRLREARRVFDGIPDRSVFSWNALIIGLTVHGRFDDTLGMFRSMLARGSEGVEPDCFTVSCVLKALSGMSSSLRIAKEIHGFILYRGFGSDVFAMNGLVTFYSKCNDVSSARKVFDRILQRDIVSWNSMVTAYAQSGYYEECKELYREMMGLIALKPDQVTAVGVLQACSHSKDLIFGMEVHQFLIRNQIEMDITLCNALIGFYAKCGSLDYASELFDDMEEKDEFTYGSMIMGYMAHGFVEKGMGILRQIGTPSLSTWNAIFSGLVQNDQYDEVLDIFREMLTSGTKPNAITLSTMLPTCAYLSYLKGGKEIHGFAVKNSYDQNIYVATATVDAYAKLGLLHWARKAFDQSRHRSLIIWTAIISAYSAHGDADTALCLFNEMLGIGIKPDSITFTAVLAACAHTGMVDEAWKIFHSMLPNYGIAPSVEQYACIVGALTRAKRLLEAAEFIREMPVEPSAKVWGALLNGASLSGNVEIGEFACDHLFKIEPENTGNYIILANLYSQAGRWEEAGKVRQKMNNIGLKKISGSSWIETKEGLHNFIATDESKDKTMEIYSVLGGLIGSLREEGCVHEEEFEEKSLICED